mmetsp:Transcript_24506/g.46467  ORF Transcript_24506/g.46467 Transcript_24506/m.46467 type:complete len:205 (+) Transcript_24506:2319-2933(+)
MHPLDPLRHPLCTPGCRAMCWTPCPAHGAAHPPSLPRIPPGQGQDLGTISCEDLQDFSTTKSPCSKRLTRHPRPSLEHRRSTHHPSWAVSQIFARPHTTAPAKSACPERHQTRTAVFQLSKQGVIFAPPLFPTVGLSARNPQHTVYTCLPSLATHTPRTFLCRAPPPHSSQAPLATPIFWLSIQCHTHQKISEPQRIAPWLGPE